MDTLASAEEGAAANAEKLLVAQRLADQAEAKVKALAAAAEVREAALATAERQAAVAAQNYSKLSAESRAANGKAQAAALDGQAHAAELMETLAAEQDARGRAELEGADAADTGPAGSVTPPS